MRNWLNYVGKAVGKSHSDHGLEGLESRTLLSAVFAMEQLNWHGAMREVQSNSWVIAFDRSLGRQTATQQSQEIASRLGLQVQSIEPTATGHFAHLMTTTRITEQMATQAKSQFPFLASIEPDFIKHPYLAPNDARYPEQWALNNTGQIENGAAGLIGADIEAERAWNLSTGSKRVVIAMLDTGIDLTHPDLAANIYRNPGEIPGNGMDDDGNGFIDDVTGWDFAGNGQGNGPDNDPSDGTTGAAGHGTSVAGCIGAVGNNGIGVAGINWNVSILPCKIGDNNGNLSNAAIIAALDYISMLRTQFNVNIVASNNSYGGLGGADETQFNPAEEIAVQESTDAGILFVASAGNDALDNDGPIRAYPASYSNPNILSVAATNNLDQLTDFSCFGATTVDIGAPGEQVLTTAVGGGYRLIDGTSFSGPYTAGVAGLIASLNPFLTPQQIKQAIMNGTDRIPTLTGLVVTGGRLNALKALQSVQFPGPIVTAISPGPQTGPISQIRVTFSQEMDPSAFNISGITLRRTNNDGRFDGNDVFITIDPGSATLSGHELVVNLSAPTARDQFRLTLDANFFKDTQGRFLNGDATHGNNEVYDFNVVAFRGPLEPNDAIIEATPVILNGAGIAEYTDLVVGDGVNSTRDVDMFRVFATGPALITAEITARGLAVPSDLDSYLRLFDAGGTQVAANDNFTGLDSKIQFFVPSAGQYFIGVSSFPNFTYDPNTPGSGAATDVVGVYNLSIRVQAAANENTTISNNTTAIIPATGSITSTITINDGRSIQDLNVRLNIQHSFVSDLQITLTGPGGQVATLVNRRGGSGDNFTNTLFDDEAFSSIVAGSAPFTGSFRPESPLTVFDSATAAGTWTLTINDLKIGDAGQLLNWSLDMTLVNDVFGPFEVNDTAIVSTDLGINSAGSRTIDAFIGDGAFGLRDVDLFRISAGSGTTITSLATPTSGSLDTILRLFDTDGNEIAIDKRRGSVASSITYVVANAGTYYLGVSGGNTTSPTDFGNDSYNIANGGSGTQTDATGGYRLTITVAGGISEGELVLQGGTVGVGINSNGAIGIPTGGNATGITYNGIDVLYRGLLDSYFGMSLDGFSVRNAADGTQSDLSMAIANESDFANRRVVTTATYRNLGVRRVIAYGANDKYLSVDVTLTNRSQTPMNSIAWMEGFNPDQGFDGTPMSRQTVNNVRNSTGRLATASVQTPNFPGGFTVGLAAPAGGIGVFMSFEDRGSVRDPFQIINSPVDPDAAGDAGASSDADMDVAFNVGTLGPNQNAHVRYFIMIDSSTAGVNATYDALLAGAGGHLVADPKAPTNDTESLPDLPYRVYYPEGYANSRASTFMPIVNGNAEAIRVVVIARYEGTASYDVLYDSTTDTAAGSIAANKRDGITLTTPANYAAGTNGRVQSDVVDQMTMQRRNGVLKDTPYAIEVRSSAPVGAILSHYDFGISTGDSFTSALATNWLFGQGQKGTGINDFVVFYNPSDQEVKVTLTAYSSTSSTPFTTFQYVQPHRRSGWAIDNLAGLSAGSYAFKVDAEQPITVALTHFDNNIHAGFGTIGDAGPGSLTGGTAQGSFGFGASAESIGIVNPNSSPADVTFTFAFANGSSFRKQVTVPANRRGGFDVSSLVGFPAGQPYAVSYTSTQPVGVNIASRDRGEQAASSVATQASTQWLFAEGFRPVQGNAVTELLRLYNPSSKDTTVEIVVNYNNGESEVFRRSLPSRAGTAINIFDLITGTRATIGTVPGVGSFYGLKVQSAVPIVAFAEHFDDFFGGGFGTLGTPLGTTGLVS